jgi:hypothetical protein
LCRRGGSDVAGRARPSTGWGGTARLKLLNPLGLGRQYQQVIQIILSDDLTVVDAVCSQVAVPGRAELIEQPQRLHIEFVETLLTEVNIRGKAPLCGGAPPGAETVRSAPALPGIPVHS